MNNFVFILTYWQGGGTERVFENVAKALYANSYNDISMYVINGLDKKKYEVLPFVKIIDSIKNLKNLIKNNTFVINFSSDWKSGFLSQLVSKRYISWIHTNPYTMKTAKTALLNFYLLRKSYKIICVCNEQKGILQNDFKFKNDICVIYNSIDFKHIVELSKRPLDHVNYRYFLMAARIDFRSKDFFTVIDAYHLLPLAIKNKYKLVFVGDGPNRSNVEQYIFEKDLEDNVILVGFDKNPYRWMKNAICNIVSSKTEGFPLVPLEAMSLECPVIITDCHTGAREISDAGKNAALVDIGDSRAMSEFMLRIITDTDFCMRLIQNGSRWVHAFSQDKFEKKINNFFAGINSD